MEITKKILHLPPYLSTTWNQVGSLSFQEGILNVALIDGTVISIPRLPLETIDEIFAARAAFFKTQSTLPPSQGIQLFQFSAPVNEETILQLGLNNIESLGSALEHNPSQANMPDLPHEMVEKIAEIAQIVAPNDIDSIPKPEPHCNCIHCQIARAVHGLNKTQHLLPHPELEIQEEIKPEELSFQQWTIVQTGDQLYSVTNRLDPKEKYNIYLGHPVGCTCGQSGCEHILAVLKS